jgi:lipid A 3-O-deacylase
MAMKIAVAYAAALGTYAAAAPAQADELFGGVYAHDLHIAAVGGLEHGVDVELGWRGPNIRPLPGRPQPYLFVSANSAGGADFAGAGISWRIGDPFYVRPGIGLAVHDGPHRLSANRIWFGSRILFEPEIGLGLRLTPRASLEASYVHLSHGHLFGRQNPGLDTVGLRYSYRFR